ncbi:MAG: hypothetical protein IJE45_01005 [Bacilli bacterium]|nr:hypothetical protein [Bacilli bacterium]
MKKSVILTISIIYILAIVVVGFLGIALKVYNEKVYVEKIICITDGYVAVENDEYCDGVITVQKNQEVVIKCQVEPDNATNPNLRFDYDSDELGKKFEFVENGDGTCTIKMLDSGTTFIEIVPTDRNSNISLRIKITCKPSLEDILG